MSAGSPLVTLLKSNFRAWIGAKGFWLVAAGALLPLLLTGAWVAAHQSDLVLTGVTMEPAQPQDGDAVHFVATIENRGDRSVGPFNATMTIHPPVGNDSIDLRPAPGGVAVITVDRLAAGETREIVLDWNATAGAYAVVAQADSQLIFGQLFADVTDEIAERDEFNNNNVTSFVVAAKLPTNAPNAPATIRGDANATNVTTLTIESLSRPATIAEGDNVTLGAVVKNNGATRVENATVNIRVVRVVSDAFGNRSVAQIDNRTVLSLDPGESRALEFVWASRVGGWYHEAYVTPPTGFGDDNVEDSYKAEAFKIDPTFKDLPFEPDPKGTIKVFYLTVLSELHLRLLIPLIALFYAAGVIADEKERGSLPYTLTRPVPRWMIPITKFVASFLVAAVALLIGVTLTYLFLFGTTTQGRDIGFLTTPLLATLLTLFAYGAVFILLGTLVERPYLVGLGLVLGWEYAAFNFVDWVRNFTLTQHVSNALSGWRLDQGVQWLPAEESMRGFLVLLAVGVGALVLAAAQMRRREFQV